MKIYPTLLCLSLLLAAKFHLIGAVVATSITPYRSLADSPWYAAVAGGDSLIFTSHNYQGCVDAVNQDTLPDGYGLYEDFEECFTPWLHKIYVQQDENFSVDADDGVLNGVGLGHSISSNGQNAADTEGFTLQFSPTTDNKYPQWFGFAQLTNYEKIAGFDVLGVGGGLIAHVTLTELTAAVGQTPYVAKFQGFIVGQEIGSILFHNAVNIDHFQYGYGAGPVPEPSSFNLLGPALMVLFRRRKTP